MARYRRWAGVLAGILVAVTFSPGPAAAAPPAGIDGVGRALAQALGSPAERAWLRAAIDASPYVEYRVPLRQVLATGSAPARAILDRAPAGVAAALPDLELYLPVAAQRLGWRGEAGVDVAVRQPDGSYRVYAADGSARAVPWNYDPKARVTLTLAASEIDYADPASALRGGARTGDALAAAPCGGKKCPPPPPPPPTPSGGITTSHTQLVSLHLVRDHEGALGGFNEIEIFGDVNGFYADCGWATGVVAGSYYNFYEHFPNSTLARAVPDATHTFKLRAYEDDSTRCGVTGSDDFLGAWSTGIHLTQYGGLYRTEAPGDLDVAVLPVTPFE
jgi:hypothetical protein